MEHLRHFELQRDPFANDPLVSLYFASREHANAERRLQRAVAQGKGLCVLSGGPGTGKTMVVRHLLESLEEEVYEACLLVPVIGISDGAWVLTRFARQLGIEKPAEDRSELLGQLYEALAIVREDGRSTVLIIDEAQTLVEKGALGELRGLLNLEYEDRRLLTLVLVGLPSLEHALAEDAGLAHCVDIKCRIAPMDAEASTAYLQHRIRHAEGNPAILESGAMKALCELGGGAPRRLNTLADNALFEAYLAERSAATEEDVRRAAEDLEFERPPETESAGPRRISSGPTLQISSKRPERPVLTPGGVNPHDSLAVALDAFEKPQAVAPVAREARTPARPAAPRPSADEVDPIESLAGPVVEGPTDVLGLLPESEPMPAPAPPRPAAAPARPASPAAAAVGDLLGLEDFEPVAKPVAAPARPAMPPVRPAGPQVRPAPRPAPAAAPTPVAATPIEGPPKDEELDDIFVDLLDEA